MIALSLHDYHQELGGRFVEVSGMEVVESFGDSMNEYTALRNTAGVLDLSCRGRLCLAGADRHRFLHGQVTNNVKDLETGSGCYAALITAKGKMQSDLNIYCLRDELLLDFEPGYGAAVLQRLEKYIIAEDVQVIDAAPHYGLLSVQGPKAGSIVAGAGLGLELPAQLLAFTCTSVPDSAEIYCMNQPRGRTIGFDLFVPQPMIGSVLDKLLAVAIAQEGCACGWQALEMVRIEKGTPRFGADMDETNLPLEAGIESRAVSYTKGCYIGQEVIARIRTYGQIAKTLRGLSLADDLKELPKKGDKLFYGEQEAGYITSAVASPALKSNIALGYVRREYNTLGTELRLHSAAGESVARLIHCPDSTFL